MNSKISKDPKRYQPKHSWYLADALLLMRELQAKLWPLNHHVALGGSVLNHGYADNDLDIYVLPIYQRGNDNAQADAQGLQEKGGAVVEALAYVLGSFAKTDFNSSGEGEDCFAQALRFEDTKGRTVDVFVVRA